MRDPASECFLRLELASVRLWRRAWHPCNELELHMELLLIAYLVVSSPLAWALGLWVAKEFKGSKNPSEYALLYAAGNLFIVAVAGIVLKWLGLLAEKQ